MTEKTVKQPFYIVIFMSAVLIFGALSAVFVTADEYDPATLVYMELGLDLAMTVCLAVLWMQILKSAPEGGLRSAALVLAPLGLIAGLVKLAARFSGDAGWWTGHFSYAL